MRMHVPSVDIVAANWTELLHLEDNVKYILAAIRIGRDTTVVLKNENGSKQLDIKTSGLGVMGATVGLWLPDGVKETDWMEMLQCKVLNYLIPAVELRGNLRLQFSCTACNGAHGPREITCTGGGSFRIGIRRDRARDLSKATDG